MLFPHYSRPSFVAYAISILHIRTISFSLSFVKTRPHPSPFYNNWFKSNQIRMSSDLQLTSKEESEKGYIFDKSSELYSSLDLYYQFRNCSDSSLNFNINKSLDTIYDALRLYGPNNLYSSFNGGKDAVVVMHLFRAAGAKFSLDYNKTFNPKFIYFAIQDEFDEVREFIDESKCQFNLDIQTYELSIIEGITEHLNSRGTEFPMAFMLGTRQGDPNCKSQQVFAPSRDYGQIWQFIRLFNLPYCSLYDKGYTSLGKKSDTFPNPSLLHLTPASQSPSTGAGEEGVVEGLYLPAYMLADYSLERAGRVSSTKPNTSSSSSISSNNCNTTSSGSGSGIGGIVDVAAAARSSSSPSSAPTVTTTVAPQTSTSISTSSDSSSSASARPLNKEPQPMPSSPVPVPVDVEAGRETVVDISQVAVRDGGNNAVTAALLIIGDEILNGNTMDINTGVAARALGTIGIPVGEVVVIPDNLNRIAKEISSLSAKYDVVITSGGIGPTHDDVTVKAVAMAFQQDITENAVMIQHLIDVQEAKALEGKANVPQNRSGNSDSVEGNLALAEDKLKAKKYTPEDLPENTRRLAQLPNKARLRFPPSVPLPLPLPDSQEARTGSGGSVKKAWPILQVGNVFILPGIPQYFESKIAVIVSSFLTRQSRPTRRSIKLAVEEDAIVAVLDDIVRSFPDVKFGSYPFVDNVDYQTIVTVEGTQEDVNAAIVAFEETIPSLAVLAIETSE